MTHALFQPHDLRHLRLNNRLIMAPMTRCRATPAGVPTPLMTDYYVQRASAGLIITEGVPVAANGHGYLWTPGLYHDEQEQAWSRLVEAVHRAGGKIFPQLWHVGRVSHVSLQPQGGAPVGPTSTPGHDIQCFGLDTQGQPAYVPASPPRALETAELQSLIQAYRQAAQRALRAGFDGVELHGANGYLLDQFLNSRINTRADLYGGSTVENRCRLLLEVFDAVSQEWGAERVGVRISPNGRHNDIPEDPCLLETFAYLASALNERNAGYLHVNDQRPAGKAVISVEVQRLLRERFRGPMIHCGGFDEARARSTLDSGLADWIGFGVPFIANPDLPARLEHGWPLNEVNRDTFYGGGPRGYTDYPRYR